MPVEEGPLETYKKAMDKALDRFDDAKPLAEIKRCFSEEKVTKKPTASIADTRGTRNNRKNN
jgi:hypothetical protein